MGTKKANERRPPVVPPLMIAAPRSTGSLGFDRVVSEVERATGEEQPPKKQSSQAALVGVAGDVAELELDRVVSEARAAEILGYSKDTLRREFRAGRGPPRVRLSARRIGYRLSVLYALLDARTEQPGGPHKPPRPSSGRTPH